MARLVGMRGRGGEVPLKLLIALIWRSAAPPFNTAISARKWAELLALPDPAHLGARRVTDALKTLEEHQLVTLEKRRGESSVVTLLDESGSGEAYTLPRGSGDRYFHLPAELWLTGKIQGLSAPAIGMLMAVLVDQDPGNPGQPVWWSTKVFPQKFGISPSSRSRGTNELIDAGLLSTKRVPIPTSANRESFSEERVRNLYYPLGEALMAGPAAPVSDRIARTGQRCPRSGVWESQDSPSTTVSIAVGEIFPPHNKKAVEWRRTKRRPSTQITTSRLTDGPKQRR